MLKYIIKKNKTFALLPKGNATTIIEENGQTIIKESIKRIISENCYINASSLKGRKEGSIYLIGAKYKPPIVMNEEELLIMIPTHSDENKNCCWINYNSIKNFEEIKGNKLRLEFINDEKITINISHEAFNRQIMKATKLFTTIKNIKSIK